MSVIVDQVSCDWGVQVDVLTIVHRGSVVAVRTSWIMGFHMCTWPVGDWVFHWSSWVLRWSTWVSLLEYKSWVLSWSTWLLLLLIIALRFCWHLSLTIIFTLFAVCLWCSWVLLHLSTGIVFLSSLVILANWLQSHSWIVSCKPWVMDFWNMWVILWLLELRNLKLGCEQILME